jgi:hypothetical protein
MDGGYGFGKHERPQAIEPRGVDACFAVAPGAGRRLLNLPQGCGGHDFHT